MGFDNKRLFLLFNNYSKLYSKNIERITSVKENLGIKILEKELAYRVILDFKGALAEEVRKENGFTRKELGDKIGITETWIYQLEKERKDLSLNKKSIEYIEWLRDNGYIGKLLKK